MPSSSIEDILAEVDAWFADEVQRAPLSYHTECYNQMYAARASLRNRLSVLVTGEPFDTPPPAEEPSTEADQDAGTGGQGEETPEKPEDVSKGPKSPSKPGK